MITFMPARRKVSDMEMMFAAQVAPLVDAYDLPVAERYLEPLRQRAFAPHAVSRWLNRAAVWAPPERLSELAALPGIVRVSEVTTARVDRDPLATTLAPPRPERGLAAHHTTALDHGLL